ncbi:MAG: rod shape-determining protein MreD [Candidatus Omnitrophica bacterium]|nr:rod shape-determining protein MreD [Candidatus Omnitrophota bacterium]
MFKIRFKTLTFAIVAYLTVIVQVTLLNVFFLSMIKPDLILLLVLFFGLYNGEKSGLLCGMILGVVVDILSTGIFGINSFLLGFVGFVSGALKERVYTNHILTSIIVGFSASLISVSSYYLLANNFYRLPSFPQNAVIISGTVFCTTLCNIFFVRMLEKVIIFKQMTL